MPGDFKVIAGLGNPGAQYASTRHNVGWWLLDRLADEWELGRFREERGAASATGRVGGVQVRLIKPLTYMNRSGAALASLRRMQDFDIGRDLLVVVDDVALSPGRTRLRAEGSAGGHNGLKSVEAELGTREYARLRIGVGSAPPEWDLADWVLSRLPRDEREAVLDTFPALDECVRRWIADGVEGAMNHCNRGSSGSQTETQ